MERIGSSFQGGLKAIAQTSRLKIIRLLVRHGELCVNDMIDLLGLSQVKVSQHLRVMKFQDIVFYRKSGHKNYYSLNMERVGELIGFLQDLFTVAD